MSLTWRGAEPVPPPTLGLADGLRLALRAPAAALWTGAMFALFLTLRWIDRAAPSGDARAPWTVRVWARGALALLGLRFRQVGTPMTLHGAVVANHSSWIDIVALQRALPAFFVAKSEVARWPAIGYISRAIGTSFIERRPLEARRQAQALRLRLARGDRLAIFPEGTSTDGLRVLPFKSSLFAVFSEPDLRGSLWVQPVSLAYRPPEGAPPNFYGWWGDMEFGPHLRDILARSVGGEVQAVFHAPLRAADFPDRKALAEAAEQAVRAGLRERASAP